MILKQLEPSGGKKSSCSVVQVADGAAGSVGMDEDAGREVESIGVWAVLEGTVVGIFDSERSVEETVDGVKVEEGVSCPDSTSKLSATSSRVCGVTVNSSELPSSRFLDDFLTSRLLIEKMPRSSLGLQPSTIVKSKIPTSQLRARLAEASSEKVTVIWVPAQVTALTVLIFSRSIPWVPGSRVAVINLVDVPGLSSA